MPQATLTNSPSSSNPGHGHGIPKRLFTATPGIPVNKAKDQASKLMDCARYLNHTGVILGDHQIVAAVHHVNTMVRALLDQLDAGPLLNSNNAAVRLPC
jgi:hypothetical protein